MSEYTLENIFELTSKEIDTLIKKYGDKKKYVFLEDKRYAFIVVLHENDKIVESDLQYIESEKFPAAIEKASSAQELRDIILPKKIKTKLTTKTKITTNITTPKPKPKVTKSPKPSPKAKSASPKAESPKAESPKAKSASPKAESPKAKSASPKAESPKAKLASPKAESPKAKSASPKPSPKAKSASPKPSPKAKSASPKAKSASPKTSPKALSFKNKSTLPVKTKHPSYTEKSTNFISNDFEDWYLKHYNYIPAGFTNLLDYKASKSTVHYSRNNLDRYNFDRYYLLNNEHILEIADYKDISEIYTTSMVDLYKSNPNIYKLYYDGTKVRFQSEDILNDLITETAYSTNPKLKNITPKEIARFILVLVYNYIQIIAPSLEFENEQRAYIKNQLTKEQRTLLSWYTHTGDVMMNNYLRNKLNVKLAFLNIVEIIPETNYKINNNIKLGSNTEILSNSHEDMKKTVYDFITFAISIINTVITNAPRNDKPFIVFQYSDRSNVIRKDNYLETLGFYSTTLRNEFHFRVGDVTRYKSHIIVPENTPCLFIFEVSKHQSEIEVLFPYSNCFRVLKPYVIDDELNKRYSTAHFRRVMIYDHQGPCKKEIKEEKFTSKSKEKWMLYINGPIPKLVLVLKSHLFDEAWNETINYIHNKYQEMRDKYIKNKQSLYGIPEWDNLPVYDSILIEYGVGLFRKPEEIPYDQIKVPFIIWDEDKYFLIRGLKNINDIKASPWYHARKN